MYEVDSAHRGYFCNHAISTYKNYFSTLRGNDSCLGHQGYVMITNEQGGGVVQVDHAHSFI